MSEQTRETKEIKVGSHVVVVHTYVTGRELRAIEGAMMDKLEMSQEGDQQKISGFKGSMLAERQDMQIKAVVVSVDGKTENVVDAVLDLPAKESEEVLDYVKELTEPKKEDAGN
jgi:hypothetical protein